MQQHSGTRDQLSFTGHTVCAAQPETFLHKRKCLHFAFEFPCFCPVGVRVKVCKSSFPMMPERVATADECFSGRSWFLCHGCVLPLDHQANSQGPLHVYHSALLSNLSSASGKAPVPLPSAIEITLLCTPPCKCVCAHLLHHAAGTSEAEVTAPSLPLPLKHALL